MKRFILLGLALFLYAQPLRAACVNTQAGDWDDCGIRRRAGHEPGSWCGGGAGSVGGSWQQRLNLEERWAKIKASFATPFGLFKPTYGDSE